MLPEQGLHLNFLDLEKTIARRHWQCSGSACLAALPFDGIVQAAIRQAAEIGFTYTAHTDDGQERIIHLSAHMNGFAEALQAIRDNPFGQNAPAHALAGQNQPLPHVASSETTGNHPSLSPPEKPELLPGPKSVPSKPVDGATGMGCSSP